MTWKLYFISLAISLVAFGYHVFALKKLKSVRMLTHVLHIISGKNDLHQPFNKRFGCKEIALVLLGSVELFLTSLCRFTNPTYTWFSAKMSCCFIELTMYFFNTRMKEVKIFTHETISGFFGLNYNKVTRKTTFFSKF